MKIKNNNMNIVNKTKAAVSTSLILLWLYASQALAYPWIDSSLALEGSTQWTFKSSFISVLNYFLWFLWLLALAFIVYAWIKMVTSEWEQKEVEKAQKMIIYAIVGIVIIILSYSIVRIIGDISVQ